MDNRNFNPDDEADAADRRIESIVGGGGRAAPSRREPEPEPFDDDFETDSVARARDRASATRSRLGRGEEPVRAQGRSSTLGSGTGMARNQQAVLFIGGLVGAGILVVLAIVFLAGGPGVGGLFGGPTATPTATETPVVTETPIPTSTKIAPNLALPPLTCIFQTGTGCSDFCAQPANTGECNSAKDFIRAQGADPDEFFRCVSPGPGPNQGDPQACLKQAWHKANP